MYLEEACFTYLVASLRWVEGSDPKMHLEETCVVYLLVSPSVGRGLRLEDIA